MGVAATIVGVLGFLLVPSVLGGISRQWHQIVAHFGNDSFADQQAFPTLGHFPWRSRSMFRGLDYDFACPKCGKPNAGSQIVAGLTREEAQTNILARLGLVCSHCGEPLLPDAEVHFSRNDAAHVWNS
jgi:hypothetical protein